MNGMYLSPLFFIPKIAQKILLPHIMLLLIACFILLQQVIFDRTEITLTPCKLQTAQVFLASTKSVMDLWPILVYNKNILSFV